MHQCVNLTIKWCSKFWNYINKKWWLLDYPPWLLQVGIIFIKLQLTAYIYNTKFSELGNSGLQQMNILEYTPIKFEFYVFEVNSKYIKQIKENSSKLFFHTILTSFDSIVIWYHKKINKKEATMCTLKSILLHVCQKFHFFCKYFFY